MSNDEICIYAIAEGMLRIFRYFILYRKEWSASLKGSQLDRGDDIEVIERSSTIITITIYTFIESSRCLYLIDNDAQVKVVPAASGQS